MTVRIRTVRHHQQRRAVTISMIGKQFATIDAAGRLAACPIHPSSGGTTRHRANVTFNTGAFSLVDGAIPKATNAGNSFNRLPIVFTRGGELLHRLMSTTLANLRRDSVPVFRLGIVANMLAAAGVSVLATGPG